MNVSKTLKWLVGIVAAVAVGLSVTWFATRGQAQPPGAAPDGSIAIPADLIPQYDASVKAISEGQRMVTEAQPQLEQILRITLDRAGVAPAQFNQYSLNNEKKLLEKKPASAQPPIR